MLMAWAVDAQNKEDINLAHSYYNAGEYEKATSLFENLFNQTRSQNYFNYYINCLIKTAEYDKAEKAVKKQMQTAKNDKSYNITLGYIYKSSNHNDKAKEQFDIVIKNIPAQRNTIISLANSFVNIGEYEYAEKTLISGAEITGENLDYDLMSVYGIAHNLSKMAEKGLDIVSNDPNQTQTIENYFQYFLNSDTNNEFYDILRLALLQRVQKKPSTALSEMLIWLFVQKKNFKSALIQAKALDRRLDESGQRLIQLGDLALESKDYAAASDAYKYVVDKGKDTYYQKAQFSQLKALFLQVENNNTTDNTILHDLKNRYEALYKEYGINNSTLPEIENYAKLLTYYLNTPDQAMKMLEDAISIKGLNSTQLATLQLQLGDTQLYDGDIWAATMTYAKVENNNKQNPKGDEAKLRKAKIAYYTGNFKWAASQLDVLKEATTKLTANDAMELSLLINDNCDRQTEQNADTSTSSISEDLSKNAELRIYARADLYFSQNKNQLAIESLDTIINNYKTHQLVDEAYYKKALIYERLNDYNSAANCYDSIVTNFGFDVLADKAAYRLANLCAEKLNDTEKAKKLYLTILTDYPGSIFAVEARKKYREIE